MKRAEVHSYPVSIFIGGDGGEAERLCREYCDNVGLCVTVMRTSYVYTGGETQGVIVGLINYPRFPSSSAAIWAHAEVLAERLREGLEQESYTIQAQDRTVWLSTRAPDRSPEGQDPQGLGSREPVKAPNPCSDTPYPDEGG